MERTKQNDSEKVRWKKTGGGSFRMASGKIIKPNQVFWARPDEIPEGFRDTIVPLTSVPENAPVEFTEIKYEPRAASPGWYDIVDGQGKKVNEKSLRENDAKEMLASLEG
jgi:hypothetical protein